MARHSKASFHVGRTNWTTWASWTSELVLDGTMLSAKQLLKKNGENIFAWAKDRFINYLKNWECIRISVDGEIRFEYATCGRGNSGIRKEKFAYSKRLSGCVWMGSKTIAFLMLSCRRRRRRRRRCGSKNSLFGSGTRFVYIVHAGVRWNLRVDGKVTLIICTRVQSDV